MSMFSESMFHVLDQDNSGGHASKTQNPPKDIHSRRNGGDEASV
eukprot:CAMPEP_0117811656 /NCGR_PEP_ID=MMETSP0948-20121206/22267_1 /TAXON_ID=44440 /ORGANISM="Chattonella subsalsa, Strain CCMP2191" /LENGTH=43 /DNA_ID= /DNA_START= /DNA_END= /DNA_ORIENTATION=